MKNSVLLMLFGGKYRLSRGVNFLNSFIVLYCKTVIKIVLEFWNVLLLKWQKFNLVNCHINMPITNIQFWYLKLVIAKASKRLQHKSKSDQQINVCLLFCMRVANVTWILSAISALPFWHLEQFLGITLWLVLILRF